MKCVLIALFCFVAISNADSHTRSEIASLYKNIIKIKNEVARSENEYEQIVANIDEYLDNAMQIIQMWVIQNGLDPMEVPNLEKGFSVWLGLIKFHGEFSMSNGWFQGLSTVRRGGTALLEYEDKVLNFFIPLSIPSVHINYDYKAKIMNLGPRGGVEGTIQNVQILTDIRVDTGNLTFSLDGFRFIDAGKISIKFSGNILVDWLSNALTGVATTLFHDTVLNIVEDKISVVVEKALEQINDIIHATHIKI